MKAIKVKAKDRYWFKLDQAAIESIRIAVSDTITQSEIMLRASCARKWFYRYALKLDKRGVVDQNLIYGSLMHSLLETLYKSEEEAWAMSPKEHPIKVTDDQMEQLTRDLVLAPNDYAEVELTRAKVQIAFNAYRWHYHAADSRLSIKLVEKSLEVEWNGLKLVGKLDMVAKPNRQDGIFVWDFKTAGKLDKLALDAWTFRFQFLFYCWLYWKFTGVKPTGTIINGLVKIGLRPKIVDRKTKQIETREEYLYRVKGEFTANRKHYFYRQRIPLGKDALERFEYEILKPHLYAFKTLQLLGMEGEALISALAMTMNTNQCHMYGSYCEYLSLCKDGTMALGEFDGRNTKHLELDSLESGA